MRISSNVDKEIYKEINDEARKIVLEPVDDPAPKTEDNDKKQAARIMARRVISRKYGE